ncbi:MAG: PhoH family protein, partial [Pseudomonadota bacterium]|nr:PhoH family protein [Pseudomonadota bacterium]
SGLRHAIEVLSEVDDISFNFFHAEDVVRHPVVARIVRAYEVHDAEQERLRKARKEEALQLQREQTAQDAQANASAQSAQNQSNASPAKGDSAS